MTPPPFRLFLPPTPTPLRWGAFLPSWPLAPSLVIKFLFLLVLFRPLLEDDAQGTSTGAERTVPPRDILLLSEAPLPPDRFGLRVSTTEAADEDAEPSVASFGLSGALIAPFDRRAGFFPEFNAGVGTSACDCCAESAAGHPAAGAAEAEVEDARTTLGWRLESALLLLHPSAAMRREGFLPPLRGPTPQEEFWAGTAVSPLAVQETGGI